VNRYQLLAAEIFGYSFDNYEDHLGIGNARFEKLMPDDARALERAEAEQWPVAKLASELNVNEDEAANMARAFRRAREVIDAKSPAESFRCAVRHSIESAIAEGLAGEAAVERLTVQICYRAADLSFLLKRRGQTLARYSPELRREPDEYDEEEVEED
jgi:hypothetical protein